MFFFFFFFFGGGGSDFGLGCYVEMGALKDIGTVAVFIVLKVANDRVAIYPSKSHDGPNPNSTPCIFHVRFYCTELANSGCLEGSLLSEERP